MNLTRAVLMTMNNNSKLPRKKDNISLPNQLLTPGAILKKARIKRGCSIEEVVSSTKIPLKYIQKIENDDYAEIDNDVFLKGFVRNYSEYLSLDSAKILALYRRAVAVTHPSNRQEKKEVRKKNIKFNIEWTPGIIATMLIALVVISIIAYLIIQFYKFQKPPMLNVTSPENNITVQEENIKIIGNTETTAVIKINDQVFPIDSQGNFSVDVKLNPGQNVISIKAYSSTNEEKSTITTRNITYTQQVDEKTGNQDIAQQPTSFETYILVESEPAWIQLIVDDAQELAQVLDVGQTQSFSFTRSIKLITGKPGTTKLYINGEQINLTIDSSNGAGGKECNIVSGNLRCI